MANCGTQRPGAAPTVRPTATPKPVIYGLATTRLAINSGPGTKRYFKELGTYNYAGQMVEIAAKCWDPNNGIWWLKVKYSKGYGWTGLKRFDASTFNLDAVPEEYWYNGKGSPVR